MQYTNRSVRRWLLLLAVVSFCCGPALAADAYSKKRMGEAWKRASTAAQHGDVDAQATIDSVMDNGDYGALLAYLESRIEQGEGKELEALHRERHGLATAKQFPDAELDSARTLTRLSPQNFLYWRFLGLAVSRQGDLLGGIESLERSLILVEGRPDERSRIFESQLRHEIADRYLDLGSIDRAEPHLQAALAINESIHGRKHPRVARNINDLGRIEDSRGNYDEALRLYREAQAIDREVLGEDHPVMGRYENNIGLTLGHQGLLEESREHLARALEFDRRYPTDPRNTSATLINVACAYYKLGRFDEAEPLFVEALEIRRNELGETHALTADAIAHLADLREAQGRNQEAIDLRVRAADLTADSRGQPTATQAKEIAKAGSAAYHAGDYRGAMTFFKRAESLERQLYGHQSQELAQTLRWIADTYDRLGDPASAVRIYREAAGILEHDDADHADLPDVYSRLGQIARDQRNPAASVEMYRLALRKARDAGRTGDLAMAGYMSGIVGGLMDAGQFAEAERQAHESRTMLEGLMGIEPETIALHLMNEGSTIAAQDRLHDARPLFERARAIYERDYGGRHIGVAKIDRKIGYALFRQGRLDPALDHLHRADRLFRSLRGDHRAEIAQVGSYLGRAYIKSNRPAEAIQHLRDADKVYVELGERFKHNRAGVQDELAAAFTLQGNGFAAERSMAIAARLRGDITGGMTVASAERATARGGELFSEGRYDEALERMRYAERIYRMQNADTLVLAEAIHNTAQTLNYMGRKDEALGLFTERERLLRDALGDDHLEVADPVAARGHVHKDQGRYAEAYEAFHEARRIYELHPGEQVNLTTMVVMMADCLDELGAYPSAVAMHQEARELQIEYFGEDTDWVAANTERIGYTLNKAGEYEAALTWLIDADAAVRKHFPNDTIRHAVNAQERGNALIGLGRYAEAVAAFREGIALAESWRGSGDDADRVYGEGFTGILHLDLAKAYLVADDSEQAIVSALEAGKLFRSAYGKDDASVAVALRVAAHGYGMAGDTRKARLYYTTSLASLIRELGPHDLETIDTATAMVHAKIDPIAHARTLTDLPDNAADELQDTLTTVLAEDGVDLAAELRSIRQTKRTRAPGS
ncbi:MAG: tetratricopeptide repeat protein [Planctomycetota bacterium]